MKRQGKVPEEPETLPVPASLAAEQKQQAKQTEQTEQQTKQSEQPNEPELEPTAVTDAAPHPDRQQLIDKAAEAPAEEETPIGGGEAAPVSWQRKPRRPKALPFKREHEEAMQRKAEAEERRAAREAAERQRQQKIEDRERFRKAMAKARQGGPNGQRKLGRESTVLLEKVKRMVGDGGG